MKLGITADDLSERFIRGGGPGGQKVNKTSSCVWLKHLPTGTEIRCQRERSLTLNRYLARCQLCEKLEAAKKEQADKQRNEAAKKRRKNRKPSKRAHARRLNAKRQHSDKKNLRKKPKQD